MRFSVLCGPALPDKEYGRGPGGTVGGIAYAALLYASIQRVSGVDRDPVSSSDFFLVVATPQP